jgi:hypothetical protein
MVGNVEDEWSTFNPDGTFTHGVAGAAAPCYFGTVPFSAG